MRRRTALLSGGGLVGASLLGYAGFIEPTRLKRRERILHIPNLPDAYNGFKIAQLTDFHFRPRLDQDLVVQAVAETLEFKPDLIALTGDFIERDPHALDPLLKLLAPLQAPQGVFAVAGNHDLYGFSQAALKEAFSDRNIQLLVNQVANYPFKDGHYVQVVGIDSAYAGTPRYDLHAPKAKNQLRLFLAHEPDIFPKGIQAYDPHLQLSGHTHGGQCRIPFLKKALFTPPYGRIYIDGLYAERNNRLFVSSGIGTSGLRVRFACPPEIALLTLQKDPHPAVSSAREEWNGQRSVEESYELA